VSPAQHCAFCAAELPEDGNFCIECGQPVHPAATGETRALVGQPSANYCPHCGAANPHNARFCVSCGQSLSPTGAAPVLPPPVPVAASPRIPSATVGPPHRRSAKAQNGIGVFFLIGIGVLALTGWWWPGIMVLLGMVALVAAGAEGHLAEGAIGAVWLFGIAVLAVTGWWWPGILILAILTALIGAGVRSKRRW
jgi:hypothetical protein